MTSMVVLGRVGLRLGLCNVLVLSPKSSGSVFKRFTRNIYIYMVISQNREPQYRPQNAIILIMGTPNFGKPPIYIYYIYIYTYADPQNLLSWANN